MADNKLKAGFKKAQGITKKHAKTFYFASRFLPKEKRLASFAVYAVCRISDDAVDIEKESKISALENIKYAIDAAYGNQELNDEIIIAFRYIIKKYNIPKIYFEELLSGMRMDLEKARYTNFQELRDYCYKVAGVVGLIMLKIFDYDNESALDFAADLGIAMQLTNILRDIKEDYTRGRIYLPLDEMQAFNVSEDSLNISKIDENFKGLLEFQIRRARQYYLNSEYGIKLINDKKCRFVAMAMKNMYAAILDAIEKNNYDVYSFRAHVNNKKKIMMAIRLFFKGGY